MVTAKQRGAWIQCQDCGHVYYMEESVPIDKLYITSYCPRCDGTKGLNCGSDASDVYLYMDITKDPRYYEY